MKKDKSKDSLNGLYVGYGRRTVLQESVAGKCRRKVSKESDGRRSVILFVSSIIVAEESVLAKISGGTTRSPFPRCLYLL